MRIPTILAMALAVVSLPLFVERDGALAASAEAGRSLPDEELDGVILPFLSVELGAPTEGVLAEVPFGRGDEVQAGQLLAQLESSVERESAEVARRRAAFDSELRIAKVKLDAAQAKLAKREALVEEGIVTSEEVDGVRTELALAELDVLAAEERAELAQVEHQKAAAIVARMEIRSPIDGIIVERHRSTGELVTRSPEGGVFTLAQLDPLLVEVHAPVAWLGRIQVGDEARVEPVITAEQPSAAEGKQLIARVRVIDQIADTASETVRVQFELPNPDRALPGGLRCKLRMTD